VHRVSRIATLAGLVGGAIAIVTLVAWTSYIRATWVPQPGFLDPGRKGESFVARGLKLIAHHPDFPLAAVVLGALAAAAIALAFLVWRRARWAYLVSAITCAIAIAAPWLGRAYVQHIETVSASKRWAARSPYVAATTDLATAITAVLALVSIAAVVAWLTAPRDTRT
jgi:hypothetical protein